jgi:hypothetical protein
MELWNRRRASGGAHRHQPILSTGVVIAAERRSLIASGCSGLLDRIPFRWNRMRSTFMRWRVSLSETGVHLSGICALPLCGQGGLRVVSHDLLGK